MGVTGDATGMDLAAPLTKKKPVELCPSTPAMG